MAFIKSGLRDLLIKWEPSAVANIYFNDEQLAVPSGATQVEIPLDKLKQMNEIRGDFGDKYDTITFPHTLAVNQNSTTYCGRLGAVIEINDYDFDVYGLKDYKFTARTTDYVTLKINGHELVYTPSRYNLAVNGNTASWTQVDGAKLYINDNLVYEGSQDTFDLATANFVINGENTIRLDTFYTTETTTYITAKRSLISLETITEYIDSQLTSLTGETIKSTVNAGVNKLIGDGIMSSHNRLNGAVSDTKTLDTYNYSTAYTFIVPADSVENIMKGIEDFTYNNNGQVMPLNLEHSCIGTYSLPFAQQPYLENGQLRVAIFWELNFYFVKAAVYADEIKWYLKYDTEFLPIPLMQGVTTTAYGTQTHQWDGDTNVLNEATNRTMSWTFTFPYTRSALTTKLMKDYIMCGDHFNEPMELMYVDTDWNRTYNVIVKSAEMQHVSGTTIGLNVTFLEVM